MYWNSLDDNNNDNEDIEYNNSLEGSTPEDSNEYSWDEKGSLMKDLEDHIKPFHEGRALTDDFAVLGYSRKNVDYLDNRSKALIRFFEIMNIRKLYLMQELRFDWLRFPFGGQEKLSAFKTLIDEPSYREAFEMDIEDLTFILPLFHNSGRYDIPIIVLIAASDELPIAMFVCDDANFHTSFCTEDREKIFYAASAVGLVMGGVEVCAQMY